MRLASGFALVALVGCGTSSNGQNASDAGNGTDSTVSHDGGPKNDSGKGGGDARPQDTGAGDVTADVPCTGLACQVQTCSGAPTSISGTVYAPNGTLPLYDVQVFVPNAPLAPFKAGVQCDSCGTPPSGDPIAITVSDATGAFTLKNVPSGTDIPLVVQTGKWRRQTTIARVDACKDNALKDPELTRLPKTQKEGSMPHIALTMGACDNMGCILPKLGIDPSEFGYEADGPSKAVNTYVGNGANKGLPATPAKDLWEKQALLDSYDLGMFSCECEESPEEPAGSTAYTIVNGWLTQGGRLLTTDFQYTWYRYATDPKLSGVGDITGGAPSAGIPLALQTGFPRGEAAAAWLKGAFPSDTYAQMGQVEPNYAFANIRSLTSTPLEWAVSPDLDAAAPPGPRVFSVETPVGMSTADQCGRAIHIDAHIDQFDPMSIVGCTGGDGGVCYPNSCTSPLQANEGAFIFWLFELGSCIGDDSAAPAPRPLK